MLESDGETDDDEEDDGVWMCMMEGCDAGIRVDADSQCVVEYLNDHSCLAGLQLVVDPNYAVLDGYVFYRVSEDTWYCDEECCKREGCKVVTEGAELCLKYPHTKAMHQLKGNKQKMTAVVEDINDVDDDHNDEMFGLFE